MHVIVNEWIFKQKSKITCASVAPILFGTTRKLSMRTLASITSHALRRSDGQSSPPPRFSTKWSRHHNEFFFCLFPVFHFVCHVSFTQYRRHKTKNNTKQHNGTQGNLKRIKKAALDHIGPVLDDLETFLGFLGTILGLSWPRRDSFTNGLCVCVWGDKV